ncbi:hypothetical protein ACLBUT_28060, partial [Pseudomonas aeruginosa]
MNIRQRILASGAIGIVAVVVLGGVGQLAGSVLAA